MPGADIFLCGPLCHPPLLAAVAGRALATERAWLAGCRVAAEAGGPGAALFPEAGGRAEGLILRGVDPAAVARIGFHQAAEGLHPAAARVETASGPVAALVHLPSGPAAAPAAGEAWSLARWAARWGGIAVAAAAEVMALHGTRPAAAVHARRREILVRAGARARAERTPAPTSQRRRAVPGDVQLAAWRQPYAHFFAVEEGDLSYRRFDGTMSATVNRAVFVSGDAATVLPYDPVRDRVMVVEQFRAGPWGRGDPQPWQIEAIAGRIDPGETPEEAARREAVEEAGLTLGALVPVAGYYPSPGAKSEYIFCFLGLADLPDDLAGGLGGVAQEHEDIRRHLLAFDRLMALVGSGEVENGQLLISALVLAARRAGLRRSA